MFWSLAFVHLVVVNSVMAATATIAFVVQKHKAQAVIHGMLIVMMVYGLVTVWTPPSLEEPLTGTSAQ